MTKKQKLEIERIEQFIEDVSKERKNLHIEDEEEEDRVFEELSRKIEIAIDAQYDAMKNKIKVNDWLKTFLNSFEDCESKQISQKQADIFMRCLPDFVQKNSYSMFHGRSFVTGSTRTGVYEGKVYEVSIYGYKAHLTKRDKIILSDER